MTNAGQPPVHPVPAAAARARRRLAAACAAAGLVIASAAHGAGALSQEPPEGELRLGQRVRIDDGTCPAGQIKEVTASKLTPEGIVRTRTCVKR